MLYIVAWVLLSIPLAVFTGKFIKAGGSTE